MADVVELIRQIVRAELDQRLSSHLGVVESVPDHASDDDPENYGCDVRLRGRDALLLGVPLATPHVGTVAPPRAGDVVLVEFVEGDPNRPVVTGRLYSDAMRAPAYGANEMHTLLPPDAEETDRVELAMSGGRAGDRSWSVRLPGDVALEIEDNRITATVGGLSVAIDAEAGEVIVETGGATIKASGGGDVDIQGNGNVMLSAQGNLAISAGGQLSLTADGVAELKGSVVNIN